MAILIIIVIIAAGGYYVSLRIHPLTKCRLCNGGGRHFGTVYKSSQRRCRKCGGSGRLDRLGTRIFLGGTRNTGVFPRR
jgi:DnaJ-class molecular chaperone